MGGGRTCPCDRLVFRTRSLGVSQECLGGLPQSAEPIRRIWPLSGAPEVERGGERGLRGITHAASKSGGQPGALQARGTETRHQLEELGTWTGSQTPSLGKPAEEPARHT